MTDEVRVEGCWPGPVDLTLGWGRATARRWNDDRPDGFLRLVRGRADFLRSATAVVAGLSGGEVYSPPLLPEATRVWGRAGYVEAARLELMERSLDGPLPAPRPGVRPDPDPDWGRLAEIDRAAFDGFWRMSVDGLREAAEATPVSEVLVADEAGEVGGYAIVGSRWGIAYLQRVAVSPAAMGRGVGTDLIRASLDWAGLSRASVMVLNVRPDNERAKRVYRREGWVPTGTNLRILRHDGTAMLN